MKTFLITIFLLLTKVLFSQTFNWANTYNVSPTTSTCITPSQNILICGNIGDTIDVDPSTNTYLLNTGILPNNYNAYIVKYTNQDNLVWAKTFHNVDTGGLVTAIDMLEDNNQNIFILGVYQGSVDFDPSNSNFILTNTNLTSQYYLTKLDSNGNLQWVKTWGDTTSNHIFKYLAIDTSGNIYLDGQFDGILDFDPNISIHLDTALINEYPFIIKLNNNGNYIWHKTFPSHTQIAFTNASANNIVINNLQEIIFTISFPDTLDTNPGPATNNLIATANTYNLAICKLDNNGNLIYSKQIISSQNIKSNSLIVDKLDNIYLTGEYSGTTDFDPSTVQYNITSNGVVDIFLLKLNTIGNFKWIGAAGGPLFDFGSTICFDKNNHLLLGATISSTADMGFGNLIYPINVQGSYKNVISSYDTNGVFLMALSFGDTIYNSNNFSSINKVQTDTNNNIYLVGSTQGLIDYNPGAARYISNLNWSGYLCKLHPCGITEPKIIKGCDSILLYGNMFIKDTNFIQQFDDVNGCDSSFNVQINLIGGISNNYIVHQNNILTDTLIGMQYQWIDCKTNLPIAGAILQSYTPTNNGNFACVVNNGNCKDTSNCVSISGLSIANFTPSNFVLYPNPTDGLIFLEIKNNTNPQLKYSITDILGRKILEAEIENIANTPNVKIPIQLPENSPNGIYMLHIKHENNIQTFKINLQ